MVGRWVAIVALLAGMAPVVAGEYASPGEKGDRFAAEKLSYTLSYRGLFTSFVAKQLARVEMFAFPESERFIGGEGCKVAMTVDTSLFDFAEFMYPVRYRWESLVTPDLKRTLLVEEIDNGKDNDHRFYWMNWTDERFSIYRKREKRSESTSVWDDDYQEPEWEKDDGSELPPFARSFPTVGDGMSYFIHKKTVKDGDHHEGIDALSLIYRARWVDLNDESQLTIPVIHDAEVENYRITPLGQERVSNRGRLLVTDHVAIENVAPEKHKKGRMEVWFSRDELRLPLRIEVVAAVGKIQVTLVRRQGGNPLQGCLAPAAERLTLSAQR